MVLGIYDIDVHFWLLKFAEVLSYKLIPKMEMLFITMNITETVIFLF